MRIQTVQSQAFKSIFETLKEILIDANIVFNQDGMSIQSLDNQQVSYVQLFLKATEFEEYDVAGEVVVGVNCNQLFRLLKTITNNDILVLSVTAHHTLEITIENLNKKSRSRFELKVLDINQTLYEDIDGLLNPMAVTTYNSLELQRLCRDCTHIGKDLVIVRSPGSIEFVCEGDYAKQITTVEIEDDSYTGKTLKDTYMLSMMCLFMKASSVSPSVTLTHHCSSNGEHNTLVFEYNIADLGTLKFYLAPKINVEG